MKPQTGKTGLVRLGRLPYRFLESLRVKWIIVFLPLVLAGCQVTGPFFVDQFGSAGLRLAQYHLAYKTHYAKSECAVIFKEPSRSEVTPFILVDGQPADEAGFTYCQFQSIFVSPGAHRFVFKIAFPRLHGGQGTYSEMEADVAAHRVYRLTAIKRDNADVLQLWDETEGADRRTLQREIHNPPETENFLEAVRTFKATSNSAVVIADFPKTFSGSHKIVIFDSVDRIKSDGSAYPIEMYQMRFVPVGAHRFVVRVEGTGFFPVLDTRTLPEMEAGFIARHIYRITAKKVDNQYLVQFWDETEGADQRTLVNEFRFGEKKRADE